MEETPILASVEKDLEISVDELVAGATEPTTPPEPQGGSTAQG